MHMANMWSKLTIKCTPLNVSKENILVLWSRGPQLRGCRPVAVLGLLGTGTTQQEVSSKQVKLCSNYHLSSASCCGWWGSEAWLLPSPPLIHLWINGLPQAGCPEWLGTAALECHVGPSPNSFPIPASNSITLLNLLITISSYFFEDFS